MLHSPPARVSWQINKAESGGNFCRCFESPSILLHHPLVTGKAFAMLKPGSNYLLSPRTNAGRRSMTKLVNWSSPGKWQVLCACATSRQPLSNYLTWIFCLSLSFMVCSMISLCFAISSASRRSSSRRRFRSCSRASRSVSCCCSWNRTNGIQFCANFQLNQYILSPMRGKDYQKLQILPNFQLWGFLYSPTSPTRAKFGMLK